MGGYGSAGGGLWILSPGIKDIQDPAYQSDAYVKWLREAMQAKGINPDSSVYLGSGTNWGFPVTQALAIAGQLDGGVTRSNLILALRSIDMTNPMLLGGLRVGMNGNADAYVLEGSDISRWSTKDQTWVQDSVVSLDGQTPNCAWDLSTSRCR